MVSQFHKLTGQMDSFWARWQGKVTLVAVGGTLVVLLWVWWTVRQNSEARPVAEKAPPSPGESSIASRPARGPEDSPARFNAVAGALRSATGPEDSRRRFGELRGILSGMSREAAGAAIRNLLDSNLDAPSQLDFSVGPDGFLKQPSSLRVFLLDQLAQVDRAAAADYAERILGALSSPDEWAVSLRNYALGRTNAEARAFLQQKWREMIRCEAWQKDPSIGFLESFDVAVHAGGAELMPDLADLVRQKENRALAHAAYLALDRLTIQEPAAALARLQSDPDLMTGREVTRANYFARANVEDAQQRAVLETYLLDPRRGPAELQTFAGLFPSGNFSVSHNLLTRTATPTRGTQARQDREALRVVEGWLGDPRFERVKPQLEEIRSRLANFVAPTR